MSCWPSLVVRLKRERERKKWFRDVCFATREIFPFDEVWEQKRRRKRIYVQGVTAKVVTYEHYSHRCHTASPPPLLLAVATSVACSVDVSFSPSFLVDWRKVKWMLVATIFCHANANIFLFSVGTARRPTQNCLQLFLLPHCTKNTLSQKESFTCDTIFDFEKKCWPHYLAKKPSLKKVMLLKPSTVWREFSNRKRKKTRRRKGWTASFKRDDKEKY